MHNHVTKKDIQHRLMRQQTDKHNYVEKAKLWMRHKCFVFDNFYFILCMSLVMCVNAKIFHNNSFSLKDLSCTKSWATTFIFVAKNTSFILNHQLSECVCVSAAKALVFLSSTIITCYVCSWVFNLRFLDVNTKMNCSQTDTRVVCCWCLTWKRTALTHGKTWVVWQL